MTGKHVLLGLGAVFVLGFFVISALALSLAGLDRLDRQAERAVGGVKLVQEQRTTARPNALPSPGAESTH